MTLSFATLRAANVARLPLFKNSRGEPAHSMPDGSDWSLNDWMTAILGELGEAANLVKKVRRGDMPLDAAREELGKEFADVVIYTDLTSFRLGHLGISTLKYLNFEELRDYAMDAPFRMRKIKTLSDCMTAALVAYGEFATVCSLMTETPYSVALSQGTLARGLFAIDCAALLAGIDLSTVVRTKFNAVSIRVGAAVFITRDDTVSSNPADI